MQVLPKKTNKILANIVRIILSNKNSLSKFMPFKLDNVQEFKMFLFRSPYEHRGTGCAINTLELCSEDGLGDSSEGLVRSAVVQVLYSWLSLVILLF